MAFIVKSNIGGGITPDTPGYVYFIGCGEFIKIGWATNPHRRMADLQVANPLELMLLCAVVGTIRDERSCHALFEGDRHRREWFRASPALLDYIDKWKPKAVAA